MSLTCWLASAVLWIALKTYTWRGLLRCQGHTKCPKEGCMSALGMLAHKLEIKKSILEAIFKGIPYKEPQHLNTPGDCATWRCDWLAPRLCFDCIIIMKR